MFAGWGVEEDNLRNFNHIYGEIVYIDRSREKHGLSCIAWEKTSREFTEAEHAHAHCAVVRERLPNSKGAAAELQDGKLERGVPF